MGLQISLLCFDFVALAATLFGLYYLTLRGIAPYHQRLIAIPFDSLPLNVQRLLQGFLRVVGTLFLTLGLILFWVIHWIFPDLDSKDRMLFVGICSLPLVGLLIATLQARSKAPWWVPASSLLAMTLGLLLY